MSKFEQLNSNVLEWAEEKGILKKGTPLKQLKKTKEEVDELYWAIVNNDKEETIDAIGDVLVTILIQSKMQGLDPLECLETAYNVISKRTGKMINGTFVKDE